jgi:hypothetical protein
VRCRRRHQPLSLSRVYGPAPIRSPCLVCGAKAELIDVTIDGVSFTCPTCGEYAVSNLAIATGQVEKLEPEQRRDALEEANCSAKVGARPMISNYLLA